MRCAIAIAGEQASAVLEAAPSKARRLKKRSFRRGEMLGQFPAAAADHMHGRGSFVPGSGRHDPESEQLTPVGNHRQVTSATMSREAGVAAPQDASDEAAIAV